MGLVVNGINDDIVTVSEQELITPNEVEALQTKASTFETLQFVSLGLGAASLVTGVILLMVDEDPVEAKSNATSLRPWITPGGAGVSWSGERR